MFVYCCPQQIYKLIISIQATYINILFNTKTVPKPRNNIEHKAISINNAKFCIKCNIKYC